MWQIYFTARKSIHSKTPKILGSACNIEVLFKLKKKKVYLNINRPLQTTGQLLPI